MVGEIREMILLMRWIIDLLAFFAIYLIVVLALNLQYGHTGIPNFGLALSVAGGAYATGALAGRIAMLFYGIGGGLDYIHDNSLIIRMLNEKLSHDPIGSMVIFVMIITISALISACLGYVASYPAIRLRADYLIMTLIAMSEAVRIIGLNYYPLVGGTHWVHVPNVFAWMGDIGFIGKVFIILAISMILFFVVQVMVTSPLGRLMRAVRENEVTAECVGKDVTRIKIKIMVLGSAIASFAGVLYAFHTHVVISAAYTRVDWTFWPWLMLMVGGRGNNVGSIVGTSIVVLARRLMIYYKHSFEAYVPFSIVWLENIMLGLTLILIMALRPQGLIPEKPTRVRGLRYEKLLERLREKAQISRD